jgi:3'-phosphoadenosine 5'-phosphosulfate sulfotransferase (PAPS reductase)/FAD synthetase
MREFKSVPLRLFNEAFDGEILHLVGTSMYESSFRKKIYSVRGMYHYNYSIRSYVLHPMLNWTEDMIYDYIEAYGLRLNPCYEKYYHSGNCYYCPYITSLIYYCRLAELQPLLFSKIVEAEKEMRNKGAAIYLGKGRTLHLSMFASFLKSNPSKIPTLAKCEARALAKNLFTCQKRCLM